MDNLLSLGNSNIRQTSAIHALFFFISLHQFSAKKILNSKFKLAQNKEQRNSKYLIINLRNKCFTFISYESHGDSCCDLRNSLFALPEKSLNALLAILRHSYC